jgi:hypothetical protein
MMLRMSVLLASMWTLLRSRADEARADERGITTLEMVVIGLGLFLLAGGVVLVITNAVESRTDQIK